jgi:hypothetical protein
VCNYLVFIHDRFVRHPRTLLEILGSVEPSKCTIKCRELATLMHRAANKNILERLAQTWETLAELRERLEIELEGSICLLFVD